MTVFEADTGRVRALARLAAVALSITLTRTLAEFGLFKSPISVVSFVFVVFAVGVGEDSESRGTRYSASDLTFKFAAGALGVPYASRASRASGFFAVSGDDGGFFPWTPAPPAAAAVSAASPPLSFTGFFVASEVANGVRSDLAVDFASPARVVFGDGADGSQVGTDLLSNRCASLENPAKVRDRGKVWDAATSAAGVCARFTWFNDAFRSFAVSRMASTIRRASPKPSGGLFATICQMGVNDSQI